MVTLNIIELIGLSLVLIPTPLDENEKFSDSLQELIYAYEEQKVGFHVLVESEKNARRRWINSGLDRDKIAQFILYNEHNQLTENNSLIKRMQQGEKFILISDEGMPAFFDPGRELIAQMHTKKLKVGCLSFPCSPILALILSGFSSHEFCVKGFPPVKTQDRIKFFKSFITIRETAILMDTAYRLKATLEQLLEAEKPHFTHRYFLGLDLARTGQEYLIGTLESLLQRVDFERKRDFILVKAENAV
jgi:16S rRNA (cytidine1402-2'-O)-methyltransferase